MIQQKICNVKYIFSDKDLRYKFQIKISKEKISSQEERDRKNPEGAEKEQAKRIGGKSLLNEEIFSGSERGENPPFSFN